MQTQRGFSLIEILIVLILIGMIAVVLTSFMGDPLEKSSILTATYKINEDMQSVVDGAKYYKTMNNEMLSKKQWQWEIIKDAEMLTMVPMPPKEAAAGDEPLEYELNDEHTFWAGEENDTVVLLQGVVKAVCQRINIEYTPLTEADPIPVMRENEDQTDAVPYDIHCYKTTSGQYSVVKPLFPDTSLAE